MMQQDFVVNGANVVTMSSHFQLSQQVWTLRFSDLDQLHVPWVRTAVGSRAFSVAAPRPWNELQPTVVYGVQVDGNNISTELITRYYSNVTLTQCCFNVRLTSATLANIKPTIGECAVCWENSHCQYAWGSTVYRSPR